jgi:hypothetical protein
MHDAAPHPLLLHDLCGSAWLRATQSLMLRAAHSAQQLTHCWDESQNSTQSYVLPGVQLALAV